MNYLELMKSRYTTKVYQLGYTIPAELIDQLAEILTLTPSSINSQPWSFDIIDNPEIKEQLAEQSYFNADKIRQASHLVVLNVYRDADTFSRLRLPDLNEHAQTFFRNAMLPQGASVVEDWMARQVYIALGVLLTSAASLGIDATPMEGIDRAGYDTVLGNPDYRPLLAVALGKRSADDPNQLDRTPKSRRTDVVRR